MSRMNRGRWSSRPSARAKECFTPAAFDNLHQVQVQAAFELPFMTRMTIGMLATATGLKITTIRYYERTGLMPVPARSAGRQRTYTDDHRRRLLFICRARELQFSIGEIRTLLVLAEPGRNACREVQQLAAAHRQKLRQQIALLVKMEALLADALAQCSGKLNVPCPVLELLETPA